MLFEPCGLHIDQKLEGSTVMPDVPFPLIFRSKLETWSATQTGGLNVAHVQDSRLLDTSHMALIETFLMHNETMKGDLLPHNLPTARRKAII